MSKKDKQGMLAAGAILLTLGMILGFSAIAAFRPMPEIDKAAYVSAVPDACTSLAIAVPAGVTVTQNIQEHGEILYLSEMPFGIRCADSHDNVYTVYDSQQSSERIQDPGMRLPNIAEARHGHQH